MSLKDELQGVTKAEIESPDDLNDDQEVEENLEPGDAEEETGDADSEESGKESDRPIKNVRGELLRKQTESERRILAQMDQRFSQVLDLFKTVAAPQSKKPAQTYDDLSIQELEAIEGQVPEEQKKVFGDYLMRRKVKEQVNAEVGQVKEEEKYRSERLRFNTMAAQRYPDLLDDTTELALEVDRRLNDIKRNHPEQIKHNPRIVMNIADDVAGEFGVVPKPTSKTRRLTTRGVRTEEKPVRQPQDDNTSDADLAAIGKKLSVAKKGKPFNMKFIKERSAEYKKLYGGNQ